MKIAIIFKLLSHATKTHIFAPQHSEDKQAKQ